MEKEVPEEKPGTTETAEHAPRLRTAMLVLSFLMSFGAMIFTGFQAKLARDSVSTQAWQGLTNLSNDISKIFVDKPQLRPYFYEGKKLNQGDPNYNSVMAVAEMYLDFYESLQDDYVYALRGMEKGGEYRQKWDVYFKSMFATSPALCALAKDHQSWYSTNFNEFYPSKTGNTFHGHKVSGLGP